MQIRIPPQRPPCRCLRNLLRVIISCVCLIVASGRTSARADFSADDVRAEAISELGSSASLDAGLRIVFVTDDKWAANSSDISVYDGYVDTAANAGSETGSFGWTWKAIISTSTVDAQDNSGTAGDGATPGDSTENYGLPIFNTRNHLVAENYWKFWKGELDDDIKYNADGSDGQKKVWTGSKKDKGGPDGSGSYAGSGANNDYKVYYGEARKKDGDFIEKGEDEWAKSNGSVDNKARKGFYGISPILYIVETTPGNFDFSLTPDGVVPEPSSCIIALTLITLAFFKRKSTTPPT